METLKKGYQHFEQFSPSYQRMQEMKQQQHIRDINAMDQRLAGAQAQGTRWDPSQTPHESFLDRGNYDFGGGGDTRGATRGASRQNAAGSIFKDAMGNLGDGGASALQRGVADDGSRTDGGIQDLTKKWRQNQSGG